MRRTLVAGAATILSTTVLRPQLVELRIRDDTIDQSKLRRILGAEALAQHRELLGLAHAPTARGR